MHGNIDIIFTWPFIAVYLIKDQRYKSSCPPDIRSILITNNCQSDQCVYCECPVGEVIDKNKNECVPPEQCPGTLNTIACNKLYGLLKFDCACIYN